jgi:hypothetical protein
MGWQQLTIMITSTLAWPAVLLAAVLLLRPRKEK